MKQDFVLEVGCENLPSGYISGALDQLRMLFADGCKAERIQYGGLRVFGTPNRLVVFIEGLSSRQRADEERVTGPPVKVALTENGQFTRAAAGFAKAQGVPVDALRTIETGRGAYIAVVRRIEGRRTSAVLKEKIPGWLRLIRFPKTMRWDGSDFRFARPVRWILAMLGERRLTFKIGALSAGNVTRLSPYKKEYVTVESTGHYFAVLRKKGVILDQEKRRDTVRRLAGEAARALGGSLIEDEDLVGSVSNLLERPTVLTGSFDRSFLSLPREVIVTALKSHQRYFSVAGRGGRLKPCFIAFADGARRNKREIIKGYERVLQARLADAEFYYREDTSKPLSVLAEKLDGIVWLEGLGSVARKTGRMELLACRFKSEWGIGDPGLENIIARAARLAKADLASEMVKDGKEFTLLQGYIGREYARVSGESDEVAEAIFEHYLPRFAGDGIPEGEAGILLALADKLDTITGCFILGLGPTGSQDPYALRRHALGLLRILIARKAGIPLPGAIRYSIDLFGKEGIELPGIGRELEKMIIDFFRQRLTSMLRGEGFDYDLVAAVLTAPWEKPVTAREMAAELQRMRNDGELTGFVLAMKRVTNIIPRDMKKPVDVDAGRKAMHAFSGQTPEALGFSPALFSEESESRLFEEASRTLGDLLRIEENAHGGRYLEIIARIVPAINRYFDEVLVNCDDREVRDNRHAFLLGLHTAFSLFLDFSCITGE